MNPLTFLAQPGLATPGFCACCIRSGKGPCWRFYWYWRYAWCRCVARWHGMPLSMAAQFGVLLGGLVTWAILEHQRAAAAPAYATRALETIPASPSIAQSIPVVSIGSSEPLAPGHSAGCRRRRWSGWRA